MKRIVSAVLLLTVASTSLMYAQSGPAPNPATGEARLVLPDNSTISGQYTDNIRKKGEIVLIISGKKTKYNAATISEAQVGNIKYITLNYTFYEVVYQGSKLTLLRKASTPSGFQYNGSDAVAISSEGDIDDLFIKSKNGIQLLTKKNSRELLGQACGTTA